MLGPSGPVTGIGREIKQIRYVSDINWYVVDVCIWMCTHHVMVAHADLAFGILLEIWATPRQ